MPGDEGLLKACLFATFDAVMATVQPFWVPITWHSLLSSPRSARLPFYWFGI